MNVWTSGIIESRQMNHMQRAYFEALLKSISDLEILSNFLVVCDSSRLEIIFDEILSGELGTSKVSYHSLTYLGSSICNLRFNIDDFRCPRITVRFELYFALESIDEGLMNSKITTELTRADEPSKEVVYPTSKVMRYFLHKMTGVKKKIALRLAEANMIVTAQGLSVCEYCRTTGIDTHSHLQARCIVTLERVGLYTGIRINYDWINQEMKRQQFPTQYRFGTFGPMTDALNRPLTIGAAVRYLLKHCKGKRADGGYYYEIQISYYGVVVPSRESGVKNKSRWTREKKRMQKR